MRRPPKSAEWYAQTFGSQLDPSMKSDGSELSRSQRRIPSASRTSPSTSRRRMSLEQLRKQMKDKGATEAAGTAAASITTIGSVGLVATNRYLQDTETNAQKQQPTRSLHMTVGQLQNAPSPDTRAQKFTELLPLAETRNIVAESVSLQKRLRSTKADIQKIVKLSKAQIHEELSRHQVSNLYENRKLLTESTTFTHGNLKEFHKKLSRAMQMKHDSPDMYQVWNEAVIERELKRPRSPSPTAKLSHALLHVADSADQRVSADIEHSFNTDFTTYHSSPQQRSRPRSSWSANWHGGADVVNDPMVIIQQPASSEHAMPTVADSSAAKTLAKSGVPYLNPAGIGPSFAPRMSGHVHRRVQSASATKAKQSENIGVVLNNDQSLQKSDMDEALTVVKMDRLLVRNLYGHKPTPMPTAAEVRFVAAKPVDLQKLEQKYERVALPRRPISPSLLRRRPDAYRPKSHQGYRTTGSHRKGELSTVGLLLEHGTQQHKRVEKPALNEEATGWETKLTQRSHSSGIF